MEQSNLDLTHQFSDTKQRKKLYQQKPTIIDVEESQE